MPNLKFLAQTVPEIRRGLKILKVGHVTPSRSVSRGSTVTPYLKYLTPICLSLYNFHGATMTIKGSLQASIAIVKTFSSSFLVQNLAGSRTSKLGVAGDPIFEFPDPDLPVHYTTFMGLR